MERLAGKVILLWGWRRALTAFAAGALAVLSQAPFDFFAVCLVSFPVLVWLIDGAVSERRAGWFRSLIPAFAVGWWFGFGYFLAGLWWIGNALLVEADSFAWALPLAILVLPAGLALFYGLAAALARLLWSDGIGRIAALAFAFGAAEWLRAVVLTGFPWNAIGYAAMPTPVLMQSISVTGLFGMNALAVFVFAMPALLASRRHAVAGAVLAVLLVAAHVGFGLLRPAPTSETSRKSGIRPSATASSRPIST
jgi:apolipoprotein N-acyltransferase